MFVNIHSHTNSSALNTILVHNININNTLSQLHEFYQQSPDNFFSVGIHPWFINPHDFDVQLKHLKKFSNYKNVIAIGECGLDRLKGPHLTVQTQAFEAQINLAQQIYKPLIIHCVKCFNELLQIKQKIKPTIPLIIHGFNNSIEIAKQLIKEEFYFSFGAALLNPASNASYVISQVPGNRLLLETDHTETDIAQIYQAAAQRKNESVNNLEHIIFANWMSLQSEGF